MYLSSYIDDDIDKDKPQFIHDGTFTLYSFCTLYDSDLYKISWFFSSNMLLLMLLLFKNLSPVKGNIF